MTNADEVEIDFELEDGRVLTAWLGLDGQDAQKSHGLWQAEQLGNRDAGQILEEHVADGDDQEDDQRFAATHQVPEVGVDADR